MDERQCTWRGSESRLERHMEPSARARDAAAAAIKTMPGGGALRAAVAAAVIAAAAAAACVRDAEETLFAGAEMEAMVAVTALAATASILGSGFIIFSYFYFPQLRTLAYKLIVFLSVADLFSSFSYILGAATQTQTDCKEGWCYLTAIMSQYFDIATMCWTSCIAVNIYQVLARNVGHAVESYERKYHIFSWGFPVVPALLGAAFDVYGSAGNWCWIRRDEPAARLFLYFLPFLAAFVFNAVVFARTVHAMKDSGQDATVAFRLRLYLLVFLVCKAFSLVNRVQNFIAPSSPSYALFFLHSLFAPVQGLGNALVYGLNRMVLTQYRMCFRGSPFCPCCAADAGTGMARL